MTHYNNAEHIEPDDAPTFAADGPADTLIIACGALAREILALIEVNNLRHISLQCLPAILHNHPERLPEAIREEIRLARGHYDHILVGYGDCGTGGMLDAMLSEEGVERIAGAHCYAFFSGLQSFEAMAETDDLRAFYLTDFLARQFDSFVTKPLGLDRHPDLRAMYFGNYEKVVYLAQTDDDELTARARAAAAQLQLRFERRLTGYGDLAAFVLRS